MNTALAIDPNSAVAWCLMGTLREQQLRPNEAFTAYSTSLRIDSHLLAAYLGFGKARVSGTQMARGHTVD